MQWPSGDGGVDEGMFNNQGCAGGDLFGDHGEVPPKVTNWEIQRSARSFGLGVGNKSRVLLRKGRHDDGWW